MIAQAQSGSFAIWTNNERVGSIQVDRLFQGDSTYYIMRSYSEVEVVLWTQEVRTLVTATYLGERLQACGATLHVNDEMRDSSTTRISEGVARGYLHPKPVSGPCENNWTTARMYYEEPVGQKSIYVESLLRELPLEALAAGIYRLVLPDDKVNRYVYRNGVLLEIQVDRPFFDLVFRRV